MKIKYEMQKGYRIKKGTFKYCDKRCSNFAGVEVESGNEVLWWLKESKKWGVLHNRINGESFSSIDDYSNVKSVKAFVRYIKKHSKYLPKGTKFILCSRLIGHDVIGII